MIRKEKDGVHWLEFELLAECPRLKHGVFLRHGGYSQGAYSSLNLCYGVGDDPACVAANLNKAAGIMEVPQFIWSHQHHGKTILEATPQTPDTALCDGLATSHKNLGVLIHHADCQAALFYDPIHHVVTGVHSGWRGSVQNIYAEAIAFMQRHFQSSPADLLVGISPSLGPHHAQFINYRTELPEHFWEYQVKPLYFDFWAISTMQLQQCGVLSHHIQVAGMCTYAHPEDCYSYRYCKIKGGHGTFAMLM